LICSLSECKALHGGLRNLNVAFTTFVRVHPPAPAAAGGPAAAPAAGRPDPAEDRAGHALATARMARDRMAGTSAAAPPFRIG